MLVPRSWCLVVVVCCALFAIYFLLSMSFCFLWFIGWLVVVCCLLFVTCLLLFVVSCVFACCVSFEIVGCVVFVGWCSCLSFSVRLLLCVACCVMCVVCVVVCWLLFVD